MRRAARHTLLCTAVATAALVLTACSDSPPASNPPAPNVPTAAPPTTTAAALPKSERGLTIKQVGQPAGWTTADGSTQEVTFVIDKITVDPKCEASYSQKPENGHFVRVDIRAETTTAMETNAGYAISPSEWAVVGPDGVTESSVASGPSFSCLRSSDMFPTDPLTPASKYRGSIVLDTRSTSGTLTFRPGFFGGSGGWEWRFGA
ncbi:hypothetical protein [Pseudonocardia acidicola]|uniref:Lipoprotein n=1 Tax=Pseudonocardia acidicola TaxID=2724939 RepID=A0ABX1S6W2_9PSEU|nr:hypothetical protein [Pseudonocardia acidicola]NMH97295.1 hypothetical protein [Pseudonocardia acidicola]